MANSLVNTSVANGGVVSFAGSRLGSVQEATALVSALSSQGVSFLIGCAPGVDHSFRQTLVVHASRVTVHCAFPARARQIAQSGFKTVCKVGNAPSAAAALHRRSVDIVGCQNSAGFSYLLSAKVFAYLDSGDRVGWESNDQPMSEYLRLAILVEQGSAQPDAYHRLSVHCSVEEIQAL